MIIETIGLEWSPLLREYASDYKKVEQIPVKGNALFSFALSQGAYLSHCKDRAIFRFSKTIMAVLQRSIVTANLLIIGRTMQVSGTITAKI